jgi:peptide chain release factor 1
MDLVLDTIYDQIDLLDLPLFLKLGIQNFKDSINLINKKDNIREEQIAQARYHNLTEFLYSLLKIKKDKEILEQLKEEIDEEFFHSQSQILRKEKKDLITSISKLLNLKSTDDIKEIFVEIRAGTGGNEASIFCEDLLKAYMKYSNRKNWENQIIDYSVSVNGYKTVILKVIGKKVYSYFKDESGTHRVQRVPTTEVKGRIHTSTCTVAIMPVRKHLAYQLKMSEIRIDTYRSSGAGGQHVNTTDSAVRVVHLPTNLKVECQAERSQHKNKEQALSVLEAKLATYYEDQEKKQHDQLRKEMVGTGARSEKIRTYNYPQNRITDHSLHIVYPNLEDVMNGNFDPFKIHLLEE